LFFGFDGLFDDVGEAGEGVEFCFGFEEGGAFGVDFFDGFFGVVEVVGVEDSADGGEGEVVVVAQVEGRDGGVEEVLEEGVGEFGGRGWKTPSVSGGADTSPGGPGEAGFGFG